LDYGDFFAPGNLRALGVGVFFLCVWWRDLPVALPLFTPDNEVSGTPFRWAPGLSSGSCPGRAGGPFWVFQPSGYFWFCVAVRHGGRVSLFFFWRLFCAFGKSGGDRGSFWSRASFEGTKARSVSFLRVWTAVVAERWATLSFFWCGGRGPFGFRCRWIFLGSGGLIWSWSFLPLFGGDLPQGSPDLQRSPRWNRYGGLGNETFPVLFFSHDSKTGFFFFDQFQLEALTFGHYSSPSFWPHPFLSTLFSNSYSRSVSFFIRN